MSDRPAWQEALDRRDFAAAYNALVELRRAGSLDTEGLYALSDAAWWLGLIRETIEICEECHERFLAEGQVDRAAMVALETGMQWAMRGEPDVGSGWLGRARRLLDGRPSSVGHGYLLWMDAEGRVAAGDVDGALADALELQRLAVELDHPVLGCFGLALQGVMTIRGGDATRGFELLDEAMLPVLAGRVGPAESGHLYCQMISICTDLGEFSRAWRWTEATERWCDQFSSAVMFTGICRVHRAQLLRVQGEWEEAERAAAAACAELADLNVEAVAEAHYEIGESRRHRGDLAAAAAAYEQAAELGRLPEPGRSLLHLAEGRRDRADASVRSALAEQADPFVRARLLAAQVEIACRGGDAATAEAATTELEAIASTYRSPGLTAWALTARAAVLLGSGAPAAAVAPLREALAAYRRMGARPEEATTRTLLEQAVEAAAAPPTAPGGLTAREWEILCAVAEGLSNREVAARLVISEKTVARHLANVYAKLGVSSRTAAAAWAHQEGVH